MIPKRKLWLSFRLCLLVLIFLVYYQSIASLFKKHTPDIILDPEAEEYKTKVIKAFRHTWSGYKQHAFGFDEYHPISKSGSNWFTMGLMIIDSLDTALIMKQNDIFQDARYWVDNSLSFDQDGESNVFEVTIRILGSFLSVYHLTNDEMFLKKAADLGDRLMPAFDTPTKLPYASIQFKERRAISAPSGSSLAEASTIQLEFKYLSFLTDNPKYWNAAQTVMEKLFSMASNERLLPVLFDPDLATFNTPYVRLGSRGDSYYEYLAKQWIQTNFQEKRYELEYRKSLVSIRKHLLHISAPNRFLYIQEKEYGLSGPSSSKMDHLVCFLPGTIALAATRGIKLSSEKIKMDDLDKYDLQLAEELARSCFEMYKQSNTFLAPEIVFWKPSDEKENAFLKYHQEYPGHYKEYVVVPGNQQDSKHTRFGAIPRRIEQDFTIKDLDAFNLLRPETIESLFILYYITGKKEYRKWAVEIWSAIERHSWSEFGFTSIVKVSEIGKHERSPSA
jgi:hypothetical protein